MAVQFWVEPAVVTPTNSLGAVCTQIQTNLGNITNIVPLASKEYPKVTATGIINTQTNWVAIVYTPNP